MLFTKYHYVHTQTESTFCSMFNIYSVSLVFRNYARLYAQFLMGSDAHFYFRLPLSTPFCAAVKDSLNDAGLY